MSYVEAVAAVEAEALASQPAYSSPLVAAWDRAELASAPVQASAEQMPMPTLKELPLPLKPLSPAASSRLSSQQQVPALFPPDGFPVASPEGRPEQLAPAFLLSFQAAPSTPQVRDLRESRAFS